MPPTTPVDFVNPTVHGSQAGYKEHLSEFYDLRRLLPRNQQGLDAVNTAHALYSPTLLSATPEVPQPQRITLLSRKTPQITPIVAIILSVMIFVLLCGFVFLVSTCVKSKAMSRIICFLHECFRTLQFRKSKVQADFTKERTSCASHDDNGEQAQDSWEPLVKKANEQETANLDVKSFGQPMNHPPFFLTWNLPSFGSQDSLWAQYGASPETRFRQCTEAEEVDITLANGRAMRGCDCTASGLGCSQITQGPGEGRDRGYSDAQDRTALDSDVSRSTHLISGLDVFSVKSIDPSSLTSATDVSYNTGLAEFDIGEGTSEGLISEVAQAQNQSVEVKKGVLVDWRVQRNPPSTGIALTASSSLPLSIAIPSVVVTPSTLAATGPSLSSLISVDLTDFPLPPLILNCGTSESLLQNMSEFLYYPTSL